MEIKLVWITGQAVPIPLIDGRRLHQKFCSYLVTRYYYPGVIRPSMAGVSGGTLRQIAYELKRFLEDLANYTTIEEADFSDHIQPIIEAQLDGGTPEVFNRRITRVRDFYEWLAIKNVPINARFPAKIVSTRQVSRDDDLLSHTKSNTERYDKDTAHKRTVETLNYRGKVISMDQYAELYAKLEKIDPVFAVMSFVMLQTFLRVSDVCEIPLHNNDYNNIPSWPEFEMWADTSIEYTLLTKNFKLIGIDIYSQTIEFLHKHYIDIYYDERLVLFKTKYMKRKNSSMEFGNVRDDLKRRVPEDVLWLTKTGTPVKPEAVQKAFRDAGVDFKVIPQMLRHTGATHLLWNFCQLHNIEPTEQMAATFKEIISKQLGHTSIETTLMYIRTIMRMRAAHYVPFCLPKYSENLEKNLGEKLNDSLKEKVARFFKGSAEKLESVDSL